ncbi:MAG: DUF3592 domain-containing protein [Candidatus Scatovivens sp.]
MEEDNKNRNLWCAIVIIFGICILIAGIMWQNKIDFFMKNSVEKQGTVKNVDIKTTREKNKDTGEWEEKYSYELDILYKDNNGKEYHAQITESNRYHVGDKILIYFNPEKPEEFKTKSDKHNGTIVATCGIIVIAVGIATMYKNIKEKI